MFRAIVGSIFGLAIAGPALAAAEIETCRDARAHIRRAARGLFESVIADEKITGRLQGRRLLRIVGDSLVKKRDYDGAIAGVHHVARDRDPENVIVHQFARHGLQLQGRRRARAGRLRSVPAAASDLRQRRTTIAA